MMGDNTAIEWTDATWNPVTGCTKVSQGCKYCYAEREWARLSANPATRYYGRAFIDVRCHDDALGLPLRWRRPRRIFVNSMSDLFHPDVPDEFIDQVFAVMAFAPQHIFQVLTKRPYRARTWLRRFAAPTNPVQALILKWGDQGGRYWPFVTRLPDWQEINQAAVRAQAPLRNVWLGVSVEDQEAADERIPLLLQTPAAVRWISAEPLLGPVRLDRITRASPDGDWTYCDNALEGFRATKCGGMHGPRVDWVVAGGESGPKARPMNPAWVRSLRDQCAAASVPFLFKQWGEWIDDYNIDSANLYAPQIADPDQYFHEYDWGDGISSWRVGKARAGRLLDGVEHSEYPHGTATGPSPEVQP